MDDVARVPLVDRAVSRLRRWWARRSTRLPPSRVVPAPRDWQQTQRKVIKKLGRIGREYAEYAMANASAIAAAVKGLGPDGGALREGGAHAVANIPAVHVPGFVELSLEKADRPYKNGYDLGRYRVGQAPGTPLNRRELVDRSLPLNGVSPEDIYFCAVELNGAGIRFYGDVCLVLDPAGVSPQTVVLDRNSYDVERSPIVDQINWHSDDGGRDRARHLAATRLSGRWGTDLEPMAVVKILPNVEGRTRRMTTGQISDGLLDDEDYVEVLLQGSFGTGQLAEARVASSDAAMDALTADRLQHGPTPPYDALLWRQRRRRAEAALRRAGVQVRVVTTAGRVR